MLRSVGNLLLRNEAMGAATKGLQQPIIAFNRCLLSRLTPGVSEQVAGIHGSPAASHGGHSDDDSKPK